MINKVIVVGSPKVEIEDFSCKLLMKYRIKDSEDVREKTFMRYGEWVAFYEVDDKLIGDVNVGNIINCHDIVPVKDIVETSQLLSWCAEDLGVDIDDVDMEINGIVDDSNWLEIGSWIRDLITEREYS